MSKPVIAMCCGVVIFAMVESGLFLSRAYGLAEAMTQEGSNARAVHALGETGAGIKVGMVGVQNVYQEHEAFDDVVIVNYAASGQIDPNWHDTIMAGIIASQGWSSCPNDIGASPGVEIHSMKISYVSDIIDALDELVNNVGCRVIVSGYDLADLYDGDGESNVTLAYDYYAYNNDVVFAHPAGKATATITRITVPGDAYNGITTGGLILNDPADEYVYRRVGTESLSGLTIYGRRKPDIVAPSDAQTVPSSGSLTGSRNTHFVGGNKGATSWSGPQMAGVGALLLGLADDTLEADDGHNEVIKAVVVNAAFPNIDDKSGLSTHPADPGNAWHPDRGYGRIDGLRAYQVLAAERVYKDTPIDADSGWAYTEIGKQGEDVYYLSGRKNQRLVLTVTWNRMVTKNGSVFSAESSPKFNLDLTIKDSSGTLFTEEDTLNNLEKVDMVLPLDNTYEVRLENTTTRSRAYALAFELLEAIPGDFDLNYIVDLEDLGFLGGQWLAVGGELEGDIQPDDKVDLLDFIRLSSVWLETDERYYEGEY